MNEGQGYLWNVHLHIPLDRLYLSQLMMTLLGTNDENNTVIPNCNVIFEHWKTKNTLQQMSILSLTGDTTKPVRKSQLHHYRDSQNQSILIEMKNTVAQGYSEFLGTIIITYKYIQCIYMYISIKMK